MAIQARLSALSGTALLFVVTSVVVAPLTQAATLTLPLQSAVASVPGPPTKALPTAVDAKTPYQGQVSCDPRPKPGVTAFAALMKVRYNTGAPGTYRPCLGDVSEHYDGRALDWMLSVKNPREKAVADSVVTWLSAGGGVMARRFGISYIIWNKKVFKEYRPERGWTAYVGAVPHTDHVHISFSWDGAMKRTSWWTGKATSVVDVGPCRVYAGQFAPLYRAHRTASCPTTLPAAPTHPYAVAVSGQKSTQIAVAQRRLGVTADGQFGSGTFTRLVAWQTLARVPVTGVLDKATWARLVPASRVVVAKPAPAPKPVLKPAPKPAPKPASAPRAATRYTAYKGLVLRQGSRGAAVVVLQRAVKVTADGAFGAKTRAAVMAFQTQQRIARNGVVTRPVWDRLEKRDYR
jgi:peptidoglycan hydrolase-like protein with peptidoglycan-binding domain